MHEDFLRYMMVGLSRGLVSPAADPSRRGMDGRDEREILERARASTQKRSTTVEKLGCRLQIARLYAGLRRQLKGLRSKNLRVGSSLHFSRSTTR